MKPEFALQWGWPLHAACRREATWRLHGLGPEGAEESRGLGRGGTPERGGGRTGARRWRGWPSRGRRFGEAACPGPEQTGAASLSLWSALGFDAAAPAEAA